MLQKHSLCLYYDIIELTCILTTWGLYSFACRYLEDRAVCVNSKRYMWLLESASGVQWDTSSHTPVEMFCSLLPLGNLFLITIQWCMFPCGSHKGLHQTYICKTMLNTWLQTAFLVIPLAYKPLVFFIKHRVWFVLEELRKSSESNAMLIADPTDSRVCFGRRFKAKWFTKFPIYQPMTLAVIVPSTSYKGPIGDIYSPFRRTTVAGTGRRSRHVFHFFFFRKR